MSEIVDAAPVERAPAAPLLPAALITSVALSACGGGGSDGSAAAPPVSAVTPPTAVTPPPDTVTDAAASRFLAQASMGATRTEMANVVKLGYAGWIDAQMALPASSARWDYLVAGGFAILDNKNNQAGFDNCAWSKLITSPDTLRQRVTMALSEIIVAAIDGFVGAGWRQFTGAAYLDMLESYAFGNYRALLEAVSTSPAMGEYLTFRGNVKYNATTGANPDENYAREIMQLFSIGLYQLNLDGTPKLVNGVPQETYTQDDITGLARVFTGWDYDLAGGTTNTPDFKRRPMTMIASRHETGAKTFLGSTIPAGTDGVTSLKMALDIIFGHANVGPFISRQLIQRLVSSNPSSAYVTRIATIFNNDGNGVKGNLKAVVRAILLDDEARNAGNITNISFGKQREPIQRFVAWARAYNVTSPSNAWAIGNTSDAGTRLGQSPLRSPTVFNFYRPGYVPPNSGIAAAGMVAPEFQITNESTVVGYINFMQNAISRGVADVKADYTALMPLADNAANLLAELNTVLAANQIDAASIATMKAALDSMASGTDTARQNRIYAALVLVTASPAFIVQK